jgi:hypothetical protein
MMHYRRIRLAAIQAAGTPPSWVLRADGKPAGLDLYFAGDQAYRNGVGVTTPDAILSCSRTASKYIPDAAGLIGTIAPNTLPYNDNGCVVEEARTNSSRQSDDLSNAAWTATNGGTALAPVVTQNFGVAPDGTMTAARVQMDLDGGTTGSDLARVFQFNLTSTAVPTTSSIWVKSLADAVNIAVYAPDSNLYAPPDILAITTSWQRIDITKTAGSNSARVGVALRGSGPQTDDTCDLLVWRGQVEPGAFATSGIPTTTADATRDADLITGLPVLPTVHTDYFDLGDAQGAAVILGGGGSTSLIERVSSTQVKATDGSTTVTATVGSGNTSDCKIVLVRNGTSVKLCANGGAVASGALASIDVSANQYGKTGSGNVVGLSRILRHARFYFEASDSVTQSLSAP